MALTYNIYINSGQDSATTYSKTSKIAHLEVTNSDDSYYQTGFFTSYETDTEHTVGNNVLIQINNIDQFTGYISRKQQTISKGRKATTYQLIGRTYDLWRYTTPQTYTPTGMTSWIVSSMISNYVIGVSGGGIYVNSGTNITTELDLSDMVVGDAIVRLSELDGYSFYVDNTGNLQYYDIDTNTYGFTIEESDVISMSPVEEADEDITNSVLVVGSTLEYTDITQQPLSSQSWRLISGMVAQRFTAADERLSAVKFYVDRSQYPNQPDDGIEFQIYDSAGSEPIYDVYADDGTPDDWSMNGIQKVTRDIGNGEHSYWSLDYDYEDSISRWVLAQSESLAANMYNGILFNISSAGSENGYIPIRARMYTTDDADCIEIRPTGASDKWPQDNNSALVSGVKTTDSGWIYFKKNVVLNSGQGYALVKYHTNRSTAQHYKKNTGEDYNRPTIISSDGSNWSEETGTDRKIMYSLECKTYKSTGSIITKNYMYDTQYMKVDVYGVSTAQAISSIRLSGSNDQASTWVKISSNELCDLGSESGYGTVRYNFSSNGLWTPMISSTVAIFGGAAGTGSTQPGGFIEYSDEVDITYANTPYTPVWIDWETYTSPKLKLDVGRTYWMVLHHTSSASQYWKLGIDSGSTYGGKIMVSSAARGGDWERYGTTDSIGNIPSGELAFKLAWSESTEGIRATAINQDSIDDYGIHYKKIYDDNITTLEQARARADEIVANSTTIPKKGSITINGREDVSVNYYISASLSNYGIEELWDIVSYTQKIDNKGFFTTINYGKQPFDIASEVAKNTANRERDV